MLKRSSYKAAIIIAIALASCDDNVEQNNDGGIIGGPAACDPGISFKNDIKPIIDNNCISCHGANQFPDLTSYASIKNNADIIKAQVESRTMPIGGALSNEEIKLISCWIDNGKLNN